ncbi:hypothetical protein, partial [Sporolactobacillus inulinus]|uniref:hypothetical protein n=1 Tax=Sporolactobacillus inulinus TaxID=2078 RepID=UPI001ED99830
LEMHNHCCHICVIFEDFLTLEFALNRDCRFKRKGRGDQINSFFCPFRAFIFAHKRTFVPVFL